MNETQDKPDGQECQAFERETLELEEQLGDSEGDQKWNRFLLERNSNAKVLDE
ncbi:MAG TPA: hypothetical protein VI232_18680 [Reyranella sp.]